MGKAVFRLGPGTGHRRIGVLELYWWLGSCGLADSLMACEFGSEPLTQISF
jgi:hypothetical protein